MSVHASINGPRTPVERAVFGLWCGSLGQVRFGIEDDFFALGGTLRLAEEVAEELRQIFLLDLPTERIFQNPTIVGMAELVEETRRASKQSKHSIPRVDRSRPQPLSFGQQRLWFLNQMDPGSSSYNNSSAIEAHGTLDALQLERSLNEIARRHEALRTTFVYEQGQALQKVHPSADIHVPVIDLQPLEPEARRAEVERLTKEEGALPFDLASGPLLRAKVLLLGVEHFVLLLSIHHIVSDGASMVVLARELETIYAALREHRQPSLPDLPIQYIDFAGWQRERLQGKFLEEQLSYWRGQLQVTPPALNLLTDRPRSNGFSSQGASYDFVLPRALVLALEELSQSAGATLFMTLLSGFAALMQAYSGDEDFCIGTPIAGRNRAELENLIGLFINMLILRADLKGSPSFLNLLERMKTTTMQAYAHQEIPFELLVEKLRPKRFQNRDPFFQVIFVFANFMRPTGEMFGSQIRPSAIDTGTAKFDLSLYVLGQVEGGLSCRMEYRTDLFERKTIERMCEVYRELLERALEDLNRPIRDLIRASLPEQDESLPVNAINRPVEPGVPPGDREDFLL